MPNVNGPTFLKSKLIIHATLSILWCGIEIWASSANRPDDREETADDPETRSNSEIETDINRKWNDRWQKEGAKNKDKWMHKLFPSLQPWIEKTHGDTDFYLSIFLRTCVL